MIRVRFLMAAALAASALPSHTQRPDDGRIVELSRCGVHSTPYPEYLRHFSAARTAERRANDSSLHVLAQPTASDSSEWRRAGDEIAAYTPLTRARYDSAFDGRSYICERIAYLSDGLRIAGYIFRPAIVAPGRQPVVIFNRGGTGEFGKVIETDLTRWQRFLDSGYVIVASNLRGSDGSDGVEEYDGADVHDVMNLLPLLHSLPYVDTANVFMYGASRGGHMAYMALERGMRVNAAVIHAGPVELRDLERSRPGFEREVFAGTPDFRRDREEFYRSRDALAGAERIEVPLLIMHGAADWRVPAAQSLRMATRLQTLGKPYGLVIFAGDDHFLSKHRRERDSRSLEWFAAHRRTPASRGDGDRIASPVAR